MGLIVDYCFIDCLDLILSHSNTNKWETKSTLSRKWEIQVHFVDIKISLYIVKLEARIYVICSVMVWHNICPQQPVRPRGNPDSCILSSWETGGCKDHDHTSMSSLLKCKINSEWPFTILTKMKEKNFQK